MTCTALTSPATRCGARAPRSTPGARRAGAAAPRPRGPLALAAKAPRAAPRRLAAPALRTITAAAASVATAAAAKKDVLILGGTRFVGAYLARQLVAAGHAVTLLTRGRSPTAAPLPGEAPAAFEAYAAAVAHIAADRKDADAMKAALAGRVFDAVFDISAREKTDVAPVLDALLPGAPDMQYVFMSSAGVYKKSEVMPHLEHDAGDPKSRHKGKLEAEALLAARGANWTSIRPTYIVGSADYNQLAQGIFARISAGRPVCVPGDGQTLTQLGHVADCAAAFAAALGNAKARGQVYNVSGDRYVTFDGFVAACADAMGAPAPEIVHFDPKAFDLSQCSGKAFPMRPVHFFAGVEKAKAELGWAPRYGLAEGLREACEHGFAGGTWAADFSADDVILAGREVPAGV